MSSSTLFRLGGLAAILAGLLRIASSVIPFAPTVGLELFYFFTDVLILFGLMGLYGHQREAAGVWGFLGFVMATVGIASIIGPDGELAGVSMYALGASTFAVGLSLFAVGVLKANKLPPWIPWLWILSTLVGFVGFFAEGYGLLFVVSGVTFGVGYAAAGITVWSEGRGKGPPVATRGPSGRTA